MNDTNWTKFVPPKAIIILPPYITGVQPGHLLVQEKIFDPVIITMTITNQAEAAILANNTRYGLASSICVCPWRYSKCFTEYLKPAYLKPQKPLLESVNKPSKTPLTLPDGIDHTVKFYVVGRQVQSDSSHSYTNYNATGEWAGYVDSGNRKDIRNTVTVAVKASVV